MDIKNLHAEFSKEDIHWRSQTLTRDGTKALALAYIDARHVMERLDNVVGAENWQDRYEVHGSKTICYLSIKVDGDWVTKADGAGDTQVEAEKGSLSDAFKRAAVKWGIGRYLYDMDAVWAPCETYDKNGKKVFSKFKESPWNFIRKNSAQSKPNVGVDNVISSSEQKKHWESIKDEISNDLQGANTVEDCGAIWKKYCLGFAEYQMQTDDWKSVLTNHIQPRVNEIESAKEAAQ